MTALSVDVRRLSAVATPRPGPRRWTRRGWGIHLLGLALSGCGSGSVQLGPAAPVTSPSPTVPLPAPGTGPRVLLVGASHAFFLQPLMPDAVTDISLNSIDYWLEGSRFAELASTPGLEGFVWTHGAADAGRIGADEYARKLRAVIAVVRQRHPGLPVRIVEPVYFPIRAEVIEAQRRVAGDPGVQMVLTADLPLVDDQHFTSAGYQELRDRIHRSLGR
jgi:hypothetical protein